MPQDQTVEPIGLLHGADASAALEAGIAVALNGGPTAFTLLRCDGRILPVAEADPKHLAPFTTAIPDWAGLGPGPHVMGILNATPDSFSDGGDHLDAAAAVANAERMLKAGAAMIDIGGESTRPGSAPTPPGVEQARILPIIAALARRGATISVDTRNADTMARALDAGALIINDVSALTHDPAAAALIAKRGCPVILMHMRGTPATMKGLAVYEDVAAEVTAELATRLCAALAAGIDANAIMLDPGFGFAKTAEHNRELLQRLPALLGLGRPLLAGISRKNTIGMLADEPDPKRRGPGSVAAALMALDRGARILRVHDVQETVQAVKVWTGLRRV